MCSAGITEVPRNNLTPEENDMPCIITDRYKDSTFFIPYTPDKSEGVFVKPLTETKRNDIRRATIQEAGQDNDLFNQMLVRSMLGESIQEWKGFTDVAHEKIDYSKENLKGLIPLDPDFFGTLLLRVNNVARYGELADEKN
jgi:hypothetical protein